MLFKQILRQAQDDSVTAKLYPSNRYDFVIPSTVEESISNKSAKRFNFNHTQWTLGFLN